MKKRDLGTLAAGMALGAVLTGGAVAAGVMAEPSWQNIYVDGRQVQMTAYNIAGNNFVKLRDIGKEVGFNVYWANGVQVDSCSPYTGEAPAQTPPPAAAQVVRVSSYKGDTLNTGDRSGLIIGPSGTAYTVTSSDPAVITVEKASGSWVAVAKSAGTATVTARSSSGETGQLTLTVTGGTADGQPSAPEGGIDLSANMEVRQEMVRLINQVRRKNGVAELEVNEALIRDYIADENDMDCMVIEVSASEYIQWDKDRSAARRNREAGKNFRVSSLDAPFAGMDRTMARLEQLPDQTQLESIRQFCPLRNTAMQPAQNPPQGPRLIQAGRQKQSDSSPDVLSAAVH